MFVRTVGQGLLRCALAFLMLGAFAQGARAEFLVTINGQTLSDGGAGDIDARAGWIEWHTEIDGYRIELTTSTSTTTSTNANVTTSELRVTNIGASGALSVDFSETFNVPPDTLGTHALQNTLTRNLIAGLDTSGTVTSRTTGESESGGGSGSTTEVVLTSPVTGGLSFGSFDRTSFLYLLTQAIDIEGLQLGHGVTITASSETFLRSQNVVPAPASIVLVSSGIGFLGLFGLRSLRIRGKRNQEKAC